MKLTKETLKRIIKEELDSVVAEDYSMNEEEGNAADLAKAAQEMADSPAMQKVFDQMAKDPEAMKAAQQLQSQMNEDVLGMDDQSSAMGSATGMVAGAPAAQAFLASAGGKLLMAKAAAVMGVSLASLGTMAVGFLAPVALGFVFDVVTNKLMKK